MVTTIILEDNLAKLKNILEILWGERTPFIVFQKSKDALEYLNSTTGYIDKLYLDNEVIDNPTGGFDVLTWIVKNQPTRFKEIIISTYGPIGRKNMVDLCVKYNIIYDVLN